MRRLFSLSLIVGALLAAAPVALAAPTATPLVDLQRETPIREYAGWLLYSRWDGHAYHLAIWQAGHGRDLAAPTQAKPFDADVGPDSTGRASAVYSRCAGSCDLYVIGFDLGDTPRPVSNANTRGRDEIAPSIWRGRLVFARRYSGDHVVPYTKMLQAPRARPSARLAGLPSQRCGAVYPPNCRTIEDVDDPSLELWGRWVAQRWTYQPDGFPGFAQNEIRLTDVGRTDTRQVAYRTSGLGGQTYLGPAIVDGRVAFFLACQGDPGGCSSSPAGAFRYRISTGDYTTAAASESWSGWTYDGTGTEHVPSGYACSGGDPGTPVAPCRIVRLTGLAWEPIGAGHVR
jgi:hypothetical protein